MLCSVPAESSWRKVVGLVHKYGGDKNKDPNSPLDATIACSVSGAAEASFGIKTSVFDLEGVPTPPSPPSRATAWEGWYRELQGSKMKRRSSR